MPMASIGGCLRGKGTVILLYLLLVQQNIFYGALVRFMGMEASPLGFALWKYVGGIPYKPPDASRRINDESVKDLC